MIYTSSYNNFKTDLYKGISISGNKEKKVKWNKLSYTKLAPKKSFWTIWHNNIGKINEEENNKYYIEEYYKQVLSKLNPESIYKELDNSFLLCYENDGFCHRHIVAAWLELYLNIEVNEVKVEGLYIEKIERQNNIKKTLEDVIKENINMRGFKSIRALHLFELGEQFEKEANELEIKYNKNYDHLRQAACYLRCEADHAEEEYNSIKRKVLVKDE